MYTLLQKIVILTLHDLGGGGHLEGVSSITLDRDKIIKRNFGSANFSHDQIAVL